MKRPIFLSLVLWLAFGCSATLFGQFQYFGLDGQIMGGSDAGPQVATALGWVKQVSAHHGFGVDLVFSKLLVANPGGNVQFPQYDRSYDANLIWTRRPLPSIAGRYRLFIGNSFFIGSNLQFGWIRERFFADRLPNYERYGYPIDPVYMDYSLLTPYFRLSFETGFIWNMGESSLGPSKVESAFRLPNPEFLSLDPFTSTTMIWRHLSLIREPMSWVVLFWEWV
ncbi:MAG: hypothetical protein IPN95_12095 [Bacteroidetes bacterium]|nr:hypothetical protein [Bacteroidota bacterium]